MLFDKDGMFRLDEAVAERPTFKKIMEDHVVTDEELNDQVHLVLSLLRHVQDTFSPEALREVENLLAEISVLYAVNQHKELQDFHI